MQESGRNEHGEAKPIEVRFYRNADCVEAYRAYACYINFPRYKIKVCERLQHSQLTCSCTFCRCDFGGSGMTLPTCRSACENFFIACRYEKDLFRCGRSKYFNGYSPEIPQSNDVNGTPIYKRDFFPGQPFRQVILKFIEDYNRYYS